MKHRSTVKTAWIRLKQLLPFSKLVQLASLSIAIFSPTTSQAITSTQQQLDLDKRIEAVRDNTHLVESEVNKVHEDKLAKLAELGQLAQLA
jgi:hypothetical protein